MKVSWILPFWVAAFLALISLEACSFAANLDAAGSFREYWSDASSEEIAQLDCHDTKTAPPTWRNVLGMASQWQKQKANDTNIGPRWPPLRFGLRTVSATVLTVAAASVASAGGIGGGGLFIPILNLVLQFDSRTSAALSAFMVLGGSIASVIYYIPRGHPDFNHEPLIDYEIALLLQPNMLLGISLGVIGNVMFPEWLITSLLASFLSVITFSSCKSALRQWQTETFHYQRKSELDTEKNYTLSMAHEGEILQENALESSSRNLILDYHNGTPKEICNGIDKRRSDETQSEDIIMQLPSSIVSEEGRKSLQVPLLNGKRMQSSAVPVKEWTLLVLVWVSFYLVNILRGGQYKKNIFHIQPCGLGYWLISGLQIPLALAVTFCMASRSGNSGIHFNEKVPSKTTTRGCETVLFSTMALVAGMLGGMLGVGGGMIINPFLLQIGLSPQVTAATCAFMVFFSASMSVAQFLLLGLVPLEHAVFFSIASFISSALGLVIIQRAITKHGRVSLIIFSVSTVMAISAILMTTFGAIDVWRQYQHGDYMGFRAPC
ncbi:sulfite exporter TauE/SafE family protein 5 isoform X2 [Cryptomeria japonica]|uniref:sulfite exporter TauE/SafE family protein 5 isoform X2 n=1 Tax=Cryptomeria japonica TaxID=3369 RepID=UPI0027DA3C9B|nr:sulfite exporter TauE/SafE family protein 5 isoform X2 [Cryptomeria japonica]